MLSRESCEAAVAGQDTVFHAAAIYKAWAPDPTDMYRVNMSGTFNVLEAARRAGVARVIYTASMVALGRPPPVGGIADETTGYEAWDLDFAYSRSKYHSRELAEDFARWGLDVRVVCPGVVLGPGDITPTPSGKLIITTLSGAPPLTWTAGPRMSTCATRQKPTCSPPKRDGPGQRYVATAHNLSALELMQAIDDAAGRSRRYVKVPTAVARRVVQAMEARARRSGTEPMLSRNFFEYSARPCFFSGKKSERELGARYRPLRETLTDAIAYFRERGSLQSH